MEVMLITQGVLAIEAGTIRLQGILPVVNDTIWHGVQPELFSADTQPVRLRYPAPEFGAGSFYLEAINEDGKLWLTYGLENLPDGLVLNNFGLHFAAVQNLRQYLCSGYFSWDGSTYVQPELMDDFNEDEPRHETGYALTQILPQTGDGSLVVGFTRHDRFQHSFTFNSRISPVSLTVLTCWDQKSLSGTRRVESERLVVLASPGIEDGLRAWARLVAAEAAPAPRLEAPPISGWCSWYNLYAAINEENILHHLAATVEANQRHNLALRVFQIDDGFTHEMGDWLEVKPQFPRGMQPLLADIRSAGFTPGLWIAPFMVGNRSRLYRQHPDWVVLDRQTSAPLVEMAFYGEFRWHKRSEEYYILDATHPEAFEYLRRVFHTWRWEWGCEYFKTDFMHFGAAHGPERAVWHTAGFTRIEIWRKVAEMIRQEIGAALWCGCGFPLWPAVGLVDAVRTGRDVGVDWSGNLSAQSILRDQAARNFANHILWQADPDCVLLRHRFHHLQEHELRTLALFAGMSGGVMLTSDDLGELSQERLDLWKMILPGQKTACSYPLLGKSDLIYERRPLDLSSGRIRHIARPVDPLLVQLRSRADGMTAVLFVNTGDELLERVVTLKTLGLPEACYLAFVESGIFSGSARSEIELSLPAHECRLVFAGERPFEKIPHSLG